MEQYIPQGLSEQEQQRFDKLSALSAEGRSPYLITKYPVTHRSSDIEANFDALEGQEVCVAGRMISRRIMGKASFAHLNDAKGDIQFYARREDVGEDKYAEFKAYDIGDILGVKGTVFKTKTGEISVHASEITLLSTSAPTWCATVTTAALPLRRSNCSRWLAGCIPTAWRAPRPRPCCSATARPGIPTQP